MIPICSRELRRWLWFTWLQGLSLVVSLEAVEVMKNANRAAGLVTVRVCLVAVGEDVKGGLRQPLGGVASGSRRPRQPT